MRGMLPPLRIVATPLAGSLPAADAVVPGCGHLPPAEDPAGVADLLTSFFKSPTNDGGTA
jgi:pimeloyl-ACP methyl ester carboxylesterase